MLVQEPSRWSRSGTPRVWSPSAPSLCSVKLRVERRSGEALKRTGLHFWRTNGASHLGPPAASRTTTTGGRALDGRQPNAPALAVGHVRPISSMGSIEPGGGGRGGLAVKARGEVPIRPGLSPLADHKPMVNSGLMSQAPTRDRQLLLSGCTRVIGFLYCWSTGSHCYALGPNRRPRRPAASASTASTTTLQAPTLAATPA